MTAELHIGAYVGVPLLGPTGTVVGMLCAVDGEPCPALDERDVVALQLLAQVVHDLQQRAVSSSEAEGERQGLLRALQVVLRGDGRQAVLQPIVDVTTGRAVAAEGLTRFTGSTPAQPGGGLRSAGHWFDDAARLGLRQDLELVTANAVLDLLDAVPATVALCINLAPETLLTPRLDELLRDRPLSRVVLEITEHAPVNDYEALSAALRPYRDRGLRLAVDDAGAGTRACGTCWPSQPDLIKIDMTLTREPTTTSRAARCSTALAGFAADTGCRLVAEGVETPDELAAVTPCGIHLVAGLRPRRARPGPQVERLRGAAGARPVVTAWTAADRCPGHP